MKIPREYKEEPIKYIAAVLLLILLVWGLVIAFKGMGDTGRDAYNKKQLNEKKSHENKRKAALLKIEKICGTDKISSFTFDSYGEDVLSFSCK